MGEASDLYLSLGEVAELFEDPAETIYMHAIRDADRAEIARRIREGASKLEHCPSCGVKLEAGDQDR